jgi:hypothetical protein
MMCTAAASYIGDLFRRPGLSSRALILRRDLIFTNAKRGETPLPAAVVSRGIGCVLCSIHHVVLEFLRGEQKTTKFPTPADWQPVIDNPDLSGPLENQKRLRLTFPGQSS